MFRITDQPIDPPNAPGPSAGAQVVFTGLVRNHNEGRTVEALEYEAFNELAVKEGEKILQEVLKRFDVESVLCVHRVGKLQIGDVAVLVACSSAHRRAAFDACQYVIDEVKKRVPIWKKEIYEDGESEWLNAADGAKCSP
ncbi:MAG: molybdenum cofactor biosynthesis protein MoaE [Armatimonadetes bacterium]|nr:molybdenum cofactor biosynthesis protein MoaE [Armatimonadota bacterium]